MNNVNKEYNENIFSLLSHGVNVKNKGKKEDLIDKNEKNVDDLYTKIDNEEFFIKTIDEFNWNINSKNDNKDYNRHKETLKQFFSKNKIIFEGKNIKTPVFSFNKLNEIYNLDNKIINYLVNNLDYGFPSVIQTLVYPNLWDNNGVFISPTGSGKTLAYLLPLINNILIKKSEKITVFVLPVHELINQLYDFLYEILKNFNLEKSLLVLNFSNKELKDFNNINFIITTPNNLINNNFLPKNKINRIVLDEFDRFFHLNFINDIVKLFETINIKDCKFSLFSATLPPNVEELINKYLIDKIKIIVSGKINTISNIEQELLYCSNESAKLLEIENLINDKKFDVPCLIFVQNKNRTYHLFKLIKKLNISVTFINSDLNKTQRISRIKKFNNKKVLVLISTDVLGRGIDLNEINLVINFDVPSTSIDYIHRVGRTGRFGKKGKSITFFTNEDKQMARSIAYILKNSGYEVYEWLLNIKKDKNKVNINKKRENIE